LEENVDKKYYLTKEQILALWKYESQNRFYSIFSKSPTLNTCWWWHRQAKIAYSPRTREFWTTGWRDKKCPTLSARDYKDAKYVMETEEITRKLTPLEYQRLQTVPDNYFDWINISDTQKYKILWNWWTVDVIVHILKNILNK
jgi:site-specific DNA-cytosine methylase